MKRQAFAPSARRIPELDGMRVLLVFIVSWYHIWQQSWLTPRIGGVSLDFLVRSGYMPVDGTILLSGFLLFLPYARTMLLGEEMPDIREFYRRRIMRVVPSYNFYTLLLLFAVALPWGLYPSAQKMVKDLFMHFTFTFTFDMETYMSTPVGVASWTLAVEMQAYLLFPLLAGLTLRRPAATLCGMAAAAFAYRGYCLWAMNEYGMVVNQLPAFLDVYAVGMAGAILYVWLVKKWQDVRRPILWQALATSLAALALWGLVRLLKAQAATPGFNGIQAGQMLRRFPLALLMVSLAVSLPFTVLPLRKLMGNRVMAFLSAISMNYYLIHQPVAVHLKRLGIPYSASELPNQAGEQPWQNQYTALCFGISLLMAILMTYLVEKPCARLLRRWFDRRDRRHRQRYAALAGKIMMEAPVEGAICLTARRVPDELRAALEQAVESRAAPEGPQVALLVKRGPCGGQCDPETGFGWAWK